jgi:capsular polysaccharide biosynthesis protein
VAQEQTSLSDVVDLIRRRWRFVVVVALSMVVGATLYAERQPLQYEASAIVAVTLRRGQSSADLVKVAASRFAAYVTAPATIGRVADRLGEDAARLQRRVDAEIVPDTGTITVTVRHPDRRQAVTTANELVAQLRNGSVADRMVAVQPVAPAVLPAGPAGPPRRLIELAALVAGLLLGAGLAALVDAVKARPARPDAGGGPQAPAGAAWHGPAAHELGGHPVVGDLPWSPTLQRSVAGALAEPAVDQAVGLLTANLAGHLGGDLRGTIVVTSPGRHQGRTTVARLLAASRLRSGGRVLRVDGHQEGSAAQRARKDPQDDQAGTAPWREELAASGLSWVNDLSLSEDGVWVLPATRGPLAVALAEGNEGGILGEARTVFDCIVVDGPAVAGGNGSRVSRRLLPLADAVLLVLPPDSAVETLYRSIDTFQDVRAPFVGVVLNRIPRGDRRRRLPGPPAAQGAAVPGGRR